MASEQGIIQRGPHIYQKWNHIKDLGGNRWDIAFQNTEGVLYRVSFADVSLTCECIHHTTGKWVLYVSPIVKVCIADQSHSSGDPATPRCICHT